MRAQAAPAAAGGAGRGDVPGPAAPAGGAGAAPAQAGLSPAGMSLDDRALATEQALQLDALIDWLERQGAVIAQ